MAEVLVLEDHPSSRRRWFADVRDHGEVFVMLARKDFQTRYKRASLGVVWAVAVPLLQGIVMAVVFSRVVRVGGGEGFAAFVMSGITAWSYFAMTLSSATTSIVEGAGLTDKVWFPRVLLVAVPAAANLVGLVVSIAVLVLVLPLIGGVVGLHLLLLVPACILLVALTTALGSVLAALYVYFRDVRFIVQAALLVWLYLTPIVFPRSLLRGLSGWLDLNPMTGVVELFHYSVLGHADGLGRALLASVVMTSVLLVVGLEAQRRHDRLFVDLL